MRVEAGTIKRKAAGLGTLLFFACAALALYVGWQLRDENFISAEFGLGYALGIIGGVMMLLLLVYPLRKRNPSLHFLGGIKPWFRVHMMLGVLGPTVVLYHSSFGLGALNSNVALFCMLIVASSGLLGRYFYAKIHHGLYGEMATLQQLRKSADWDLGELVVQLPFLPQLAEQLKAYESHAMAASYSWLNVIKLPWLTVSSAIVYQRLSRQCKRGIQQASADPKQQQKLYKEARKHLHRYLDSVVRVAELDFYQRLFSLWHVLHLPLFVMMLITSVIHIIAVHMY